jgi:hypothetical protein
MIKDTLYSLSEALKEAGAQVMTDLKVFSAEKPAVI